MEPDGPSLAGLWASAASYNSFASSYSQSESSLWHNSGAGKQASSSLRTSSSILLNCSLLDSVILFTSIDNHNRDSPDPVESNLPRVWSWVVVSFSYCVPAFLVIANLDNTVDY